MELYDFLSTCYDSAMNARIIGNTYEDSEIFYGTIEDACNSLSYLIARKHIKRWLVDDNYDIWIYI